ncbi:hypothetical protein ADM96_33125 [Burkholderia sp. ST111]|nr:hypothetical protein ADM96_33125 [Burkholderia sp. ST111]
MRERTKADIERKLKFLDFAKFHFISAAEKTGIGPLMRSVDGAYAAAMAKLPTPKLTRALIEAVEFQQPRRRGPCARNCVTRTRADRIRRSS